jgi:hypothetical protein
MTYILSLQSLATPKESMTECPSLNSWFFCGDHTGHSDASDFACG